jgi:hypothetical protein
MVDDDKLLEGLHMHHSGCERHVLNSTAAERRDDVRESRQTSHVSLGQRYLKQVKCRVNLDLCVGDRASAVLGAASILGAAGAGWLAWH